MSRIHSEAPGRTGLKDDADKLPIELVPTEGIRAAARIFRYGAVEKKRPGGLEGYGVNNWRGGMKWTRLYGATQRHLQAWLDGDDLDEESGLPHLWHALTCVLMLVWMAAHRPDLDDRYKAPVDPTARPKRKP